jgi:Lar family restriction alleviation protein
MISVNEVDLKPCPFCGSPCINDKGYIRDGSSVFCSECGARVTAYEPRSREKAIVKWNKRACDCFTSKDEPGMEIDR